MASTPVNNDKLRLAGMEARGMLHEVRQDGEKMEIGS